MKGPPYNRRKGVVSVGYKITTHYTREIPEYMLMRLFTLEIIIMCDSVEIDLTYVHCNDPLGSVSYKQCVNALKSCGITPDRILKWVDPVSQESAFQDMDMSRVYLEYDEIHDGSTLMVHIRPYSVELERLWHTTRLVETYIKVALCRVVRKK